MKAGTHHGREHFVGLAKVGQGIREDGPRIGTFSRTSSRTSGSPSSRLPDPRFSRSSSSPSWGRIMPLTDQNIAEVTVELQRDEPRTNAGDARRGRGADAHEARGRGDNDEYRGGRGGVEKAVITLKLVDGDKRDKKILEFMNEIRPSLAVIPDADIMVTTSGEGGTRRPTSSCRSSPPIRRSFPPTEVALRDRRADAGARRGADEREGRKAGRDKAREKPDGPAGLDPYTTGMVLRTSYEREKAASTGNWGRSTTYA